MVAQIIIQVIIIGGGVFRDSRKARWEYFNEFILMMVLYTMLCFSPFISDLSVKYAIGYVSIFIVALHLVLNIFFIFKNSFTVSKFKLKKRV